MVEKDVPNIVLLKTTTMLPDNKDLGVIMSWAINYNNSQDTIYFT